MQPTKPHTLPCRIVRLLVLVAIGCWMLLIAIPNAL